MLIAPTFDNESAMRDKISSTSTNSGKVTSWRMKLLDVTLGSRERGCPRKELHIYPIVADQSDGSPESRRPQSPGSASCYYNLVPIWSSSFSNDGSAEGVIACNVGTPSTELVERDADLVENIAPSAKRCAARKLRIEHSAGVPAHGCELFGAP
jgi:hypothetical protein